MSNDSLIRVAALVMSAALAFVSCASSHAPRGWLDEPEDLPRSAYGGWLEIQKGAPGSLVEGEFLAVGSESVYVLAESRFEAIPKSAIRKARLEAHRPQTGSAVGLTIGGTAGALSHGLGFIISGPIWIVVGSIAAGSVSREPNHEVPSRSWDQVSVYARFPQGLPPELDRGALRPKSRARTGETLTVLLGTGEVLKVRSIEVSAMGYVKATMPDGKERFFDAVHIRSVVDPEGRDVTRNVLAGEMKRP